MELRFQKSLAKSYKKLSLLDMHRVDSAVKIFQENPFSESLRNHALKGKIEGQRAFLAGFDLRVIYREEGDHAVVYLLKTGSHSQVFLS